MSEIQLTKSPPEAFRADYANVREMPSDVAASRIVQSLILAKGDLGKYKGILTHFLDLYKAEERAALSALPPDSAQSGERKGEA